MEGYILYLLKPIKEQRNHECWSHSTHKYDHGDILVKGAKTPGEARSAANKKFSIAASSQPSGNSLTSPWIKSKIIQVEPVDDECLIKWIPYEIVQGEPVDRNCLINEKLVKVIEYSSRLSIPD